MKSRRTSVAWAAMFAWLLSGSCFTRATVLNIQQCNQQRSQWCWAAVSQSILRYYGVNRTQQQIANVSTDEIHVATQVSRRHLQRPPHHLPRGSPDGLEQSIGRAHPSLDQG